MMSSSDYSEDVYDKLERAGTFKKVDTCTAFLGVHDAVLSSVEFNDSLLCQVMIAATETNTLKLLIVVKKNTIILVIVLLFYCNGSVKRSLNRLKLLLKNTS